MNPELTNDLPFPQAMEQEATAPAPPHEPMAPVAPSERIDVIDILRGLALFGILTANMRAFAAPFELYGNINRMFTANIDWIAQAFVNTAFQGKFVTLFSFLFGLGFAVQMTRAEERGRSVSFYPRRLFFLLLIGLFHAWIIWPGDILIGYALCGFLLFLFRKRSQKTIAIWALSLFAVFPLLFTGFYIAGFFGVGLPGGPGDPQKLNLAIQHAISVYRDGSWFSRVQLNFQEWKQSYSGPSPIFLMLFVLPRFLTGLWIWRSGLLKNPTQYLPLVKKVALWGFATGLVMDAIVLYIRFIIDPPNGKMTGAAYIMTMARDISLPAIAAFYAASVMLLVQSVKWRSIVAPFGAIGRMALTNYLLQSLICTTFFHYTKLYGKMGPAVGLIPTVILFGLQIPFSVWWLKNYQFGPAEWLWRSLTYGKMQPMRKQAAYMQAAA